MAITAASSMYENESALDSWIRELNFYETEIKCCELSLEELVVKPISREALVRIEQLQNRFILQRELINDLKYKLRHVPHAPGQEWECPPGLETELRSYRKSFYQLLDEFDHFAQVWLS